MKQFCNKNIYKFIKCGIIPKRNEKVDSYISRASSLIKNGVGKFNSSIDEVKRFFDEYGIDLSWLDIEEREYCSFDDIAFVSIEGSLNIKMSIPKNIPFFLRLFGITRYFLFQHEAMHVLRYMQSDKYDEAFACIHERANIFKYLRSSDGNSAIYYLIIISSILHLYSSYILLFPIILLLVLVFQGILINRKINKCVKYFKFMYGNNYLLALSMLTGKEIDKFNKKSFNPDKFKDFRKDVFNFLKR